MSSNTRPESTNPRITRVYTRIGDGGETLLVGNRRVHKSDPRVAAYGTVDELQALMGWTRDQLESVRSRIGDGGPAGRMDLLVRHLTYFQNQIFTLNSDLATRIEDRWDNMPLISEEDIVYLEQVIDAYNADLPPLADFVLPGGHEAQSALHLCRVVCRRAEREVARLAQSEAICTSSQPFLNRLSDGFFVWSRVVGKILEAAGMSEAEIIWQHQMERPPLPKK